MNIYLSEKFENVYDCESVGLYTAKMLDEMMKDVMDMPRMLGLGSPIIYNYNITNRIPVDKRKCIQFTSDIKNRIIISRTHNTSAFHSDKEETVSVSTAIANIVLLNKYDYTQEVFLPDISTIFSSRTIPFWFENSTTIEGCYLFQNSASVRLFAALHEDKLAVGLALASF